MEYHLELDGLFFFFREVRHGGYSQDGLGDSYPKASAEATRLCA